MDNREQLSALMDGELGPAEREAMIDRLLQDEDLAREWGRWETARAALHHEAVPASVDLVGRIADAIRDEPVVEAPAPAAVVQLPLRRRWAPRHYIAGAAMAASFVFGIFMAGQMMGPLSGSAGMAGLGAGGERLPVVALTAASEADPSLGNVTERQRFEAYAMAHAESSRQSMTDGLLAYAPVAVMDGSPDELVLLDPLESDASAMMVE